MSSNSSDEAGLTPANTSLIESCTNPELPPYHPATAAVAPYKGATFIIRDPQSGLIIALKDGKLGLGPADKGNASIGFDIGHGSHWRCVENEDRWLGFKNAASGEFIGHNNNKKKWCFMAKGEAHGDWQHFCVRQHPSGGHELLVKHWDGFRAMEVGGDDNRELVVAGEGLGGIAWEFLKVYSEM